MELGDHRRGTRAIRLAMAACPHDNPGVMAHPAHVALRGQAW